MNCSRIVKGNITKTLQQWDDNPFQISILNILWELIPGFLDWNIWKMEMEIMLVEEIIDIGKKKIDDVGICITKI